MSDSNSAPRREVTLALADAMVRRALDEAARRGVVVSAAVVDGGGHLVRFSRMDAAEIAGPTLAVDKAFTAVAHRIDTAELTSLAAPGGELFGLFANGGGRYVTFAGGVPLWSGDRVVGGVGVSGASGVDDAACARAAAEVWVAPSDAGSAEETE